MFTCKNCRKKVPTINAKNQLCVDCDRARKREVPKDAYEQKKEELAQPEKAYIKEPEEDDKPPLLKEEEKTEAKWP